MTLFLAFAKMCRSRKASGHWWDGRGVERAVAPKMPVNPARPGPPPAFQGTYFLLTLTSWSAAML